MIRTICLMLLCLPLCVFGQNKVGKTKDDVKKELDTWAGINSHYQPKIVSQDTTILLSIVDPVSGNVQFLYTFTRDGVCITEKTQTLCDSCRRNYLNAVLEQSGYQWKKINGNQYVSKFSDHLMIELPGDEKDHSFTIYNPQWTKEVYDLLIKN